MFTMSNQIMYCNTVPKFSYSPLISKIYKQTPDDIPFTVINISPDEYNLEGKAFLGNIEEFPEEKIDICQFMTNFYIAHQRIQNLYVLWQILLYIEK